MPAIRSEETGVEILLDQVVQVVVALENDVSATTAIATAWAALRDELLAVKGNAATATVPGAGEDSDFVNEHKSGARRRRSG
jgi:hypothetical protein